MRAWAVFGFPLRAGAVRLGALNLYRGRSGALSGDQQGDALVVAEVAARWVLEAQAGAQARLRCRPGGGRRAST